MKRNTNQNKLKNTRNLLCNIKTSRINNTLTISLIICYNKKEAR